MKKKPRSTKVSTPSVPFDGCFAIVPYKHDSRMPVIVAIQNLIDSSIGGDSLISVWKLELINLVEFSTLKFVSFSKQESVETGLSIVLGSASLALMEKTNGVYDPFTWGRTLFSLGLSGLVFRAVELVKGLVSLPSAAHFYHGNEFEQSPRDMLALLAQKKERGVWLGYSHYRADLNSRAYARDMIELGKYVVSVIYPKRPFRSAFPPDDPLVPLADQVVNSVCLRAVLGWKPGIVLSLDEASGAKVVLRAQKPKGLEVMRARYDEFVSTIPEHLRYLLVYNGVDWFESHITNFKNTKKRVVVDGNAYHISIAL